MAEEILESEIVHKKKKLSKRKKIIIVVSTILVVLLLLIFLVVPYTASIVIYNSVFNQRYSSSTYLSYNIKEFEGLKSERYEFQSYDNETLVGYRYYTENTQACGVVVIAHGLGGGGHNNYMDVAYYFACNGFEVFAYDATGNDESGGDAITGLPQGLKDLSRAIEYLDEVPKLKDLPIFLWGHSWGGYCVANVLNFHPEVKAIVSMAGFNRSSDLLYAQGKDMVGGIMDFMLPFVNSYEEIMFGKYAKSTAMDGFAKSNAGAYIVHSADDKTVPIKYGYDVYYEKYASNDRFVFKKYEDKGHNEIYYSQEAIEYIKNFNAKFKEYFKGREITTAEREEYITNNLDRSVWCNLIDKDLFADIVEFYKSFI